MGRHSVSALRIASTAVRPSSAVETRPRSLDEIAEKGSHFRTIIHP